MKKLSIGGLSVGNDLPLTVIAGPCQLETLDHALMIADTMAETCAKVGAGYVFKASYDKANRTSLSGIRGPGMDEGLAMLAEVKARLGATVYKGRLVDIASIKQAEVIVKQAEMIAAG